MAFSVQMPALGESVTEGTVTRWLKQEGDRVEIDEPLLEVSTDKVDTEIPSPAAGVLQRIVAAEDETVEVGGELAVIGDGQADSSDNSGGAEPAPAPNIQAPDTPPSAAQPSVAQVQPREAPVAEAAPSSSGSGTSVVMPELGESVTEGTVTRWLKQVGDTVEVDEPLLEVSTDKVDTEIPSPVAGTVLELTVGEDETVEVGAQLALVGDADAGPAQQPQDPPTDVTREEQTAGQTEPEPARSEPEQTSSNGRAEQPLAERSSPPAVPAEHAERVMPGGGERPGGAPYVTPLVRKLATEHDIDLATVAGTGVGGRIRKQDVLAAAAERSKAEQARRERAAAEQPKPGQPDTEQPGPVPARSTSVQPAAPAQPAATAKPSVPGPRPGTTVKLPRLRQVIAARMTESLKVSAQLTTVQEVDLTRIVTLRARAKADFEVREGVKLTYLPFFAKATVEALKAFPQLNASINEATNEVTYHGAVHLAIAVDTPRGLLVPVIHNADDLNLAGLAKKIADLAARSRTSRIGPDELGGGTFTLTNIGSAGALFDTPIINQPQVAILGTGAIVKEPKVVTGPDGEDLIAVRSVCFLPLTYDHRLVDGADAGRFVSAIRARLEAGAFGSELGL